MSVFLTAVLALSSPAAQGRNASAQTLVYTPAREIADQNIKIRGWGSGTGSETDETYYEGAHSIRVSTRNYFQGAQLQFGTPVDLADKFADKNNLLKIVVKTSDADTTTGGMGAPGMSGSGVPGGGGRLSPTGGGVSGRGPGMGGPGMSGSGGPGMGMPGMGGGMPGRGGQGGGRPGSMGMPGGMGMQGGMGASTGAPTLTTVRMIVATTDGKKSEAYLPLPSNASSAERGWKTVAIPLQAINGFDRTNKTIKEITFSGDVTTTFYVGDVRVVEDPTPIRGDVYTTFNGVTSSTRRSYNLALGDRLTFTGGGEGGASVLEYAWDFNGADGIQDDAVGQTVTHQFRNAGKFTVTLTIRDKYGLKPPTKSSVDVVVNP